jgi:hypothetical protein
MFSAGQADRDIRGTAIFTGDTMTTTIQKIRALLIAGLIIGIVFLPDVVNAQDKDLPVYLRDRGTGVPSSMFGTYIRRGELILYPYFEYYYDNDFEYAPNEFGFELDQDFRGEYRAYEGLIFIGYGLTDWLAFELEAAVIKATLKKSPDDPTNMPEKIEESGLGDVESQLRWRWMKENERRPELFSYFETVFPLQKDKDLIGTPNWEFKLGIGGIKGFSWGTVTLRAAAEYDEAENEIAAGEYAVEYLKRLSPSWRVFLAVEGTEDEVELIPEVQWRFAEFATLKLNSAFGLTSKATDWAPEIGIMFSFPLR